MNRVTPVAAAASMICICISISPPNIVLIGRSWPAKACTKDEGVNSGVTWCTLVDCTCNGRDRVCDRNVKTVIPYVEGSEEGFEGSKVLMMERQSSQC